MNFYTAPSVAQEVKWFEVVVWYKNKITFKINDQIERDEKILIKPAKWRVQKEK